MFTHWTLQVLITQPTLTVWVGLDYFKNIHYVMSKTSLYIRLPDRTQQAFWLKRQVEEFKYYFNIGPTVFLEDTFFFFHAHKMYQLSSLCNLSNSNPQRIISFIFMKFWRYIVQLIKQNPWISLKICWTINMQRKVAVSGPIFKLVDLNAFSLSLKMALFPWNKENYQTDIPLLHLFEYHFRTTLGK